MTETFGRPPGGVPAIPLLGPSGSSKMTLGVRLIRAFQNRGYRVATIKSAQRHDGPADREGSDTARYRHAGAVAGAGVFADGTIVTFPEADLATLLTLLRPVADLVLVEGFRGADLPTLLFGSEDTRLDPAAEPVIAQIVEEWGPARESDVPIFQRDEIVGIAATVESWLSNATPTGH